MASSAAVALINSSGHAHYLFMHVRLKAHGNNLTTKCRPCWVKEGTYILGGKPTFPFTTTVSLAADTTVSMNNKIL